jgi:hypothetical protein
MANAGFGPIRWARAVPPVLRRDGRPDATAHHVLLALATWADKDGRARPAVASLADATTLSDDTVTAALGRLAAAGLIRSDGPYGGSGPDVWVLAMDRARSDVDADPLGRRERSRSKTAERVARYRRKLRVVTVSDTVTDDVGNAVRHRDVTPSDTVTSRGVTVSHAVSNGAMTVTPAGHSARTAIELPIELPLNSTRSEAGSGRVKTHTYPQAFEAFWVAYGRKGSKRTAAAEWSRAISRASPEAIMAAVGPYVASTPNLKYRKDAERWLKGDCWESAVVPHQAAVNGHQPYRNPDDQSAYDEPI